MNRFRNLTLSAGSAALLLLAVTLTPLRQPLGTSVDGIAKAAGGNLSSVFVTNTTANPVPVTAQGTTTIAGDVGVMSMPAVKLDPTGNTIQVANTAANPVAMMNVNDAQHPFQDLVNLDFADGSSFVSTNVTTVPAGKRLVVETVTLAGQLPVGQKLVGVNLFSSLATWPILPTDEGPVGSEEFFGAFQQGRMYFEPGTLLTLSATRIGGATGADGESVTIAGYLVNAS